MTEPTEEDMAAQQQAERAAALAPLRDLGVGRDDACAVSVAGLAVGLRALQQNPAYQVLPLSAHLNAAAVGLQGLESAAGSEIRALEAAGAFEPPE